MQVLKEEIKHAGPYLTQTVRHYGHLQLAKFFNSRFQAIRMWSACIYPNPVMKEISPATNHERNRCLYIYIYIYNQLKRIGISTCTFSWTWRFCLALQSVMCLKSCACILSSVKLQNSHLVSSELPVCIPQEKKKCSCLILCFVCFLACHWSKNCMVGNQIVLASGTIHIFLLVIYLS
jgi:hypothetical protein